MIEEGLLMKKREKTLCVIIGLAFCLSAFLAQGAEPTGRDIMIKVDERPEGKDQKSLMKMTLVNKRGKTRERSLLTFSKCQQESPNTANLFLQSSVSLCGIGLTSSVFRCRELRSVKEKRAPTPLNRFVTLGPFSLSFSFSSLI